MHRLLAFIVEGYFVSKLTVSSLSVLFLIVTLAGLSQRNALACEFIMFSDYSEIAPNIFASPSFANDSSEHVLTLISSGTARVNSTFGDMISSPKVVITATVDEASDFGANAYGRALLSPLGQCIVLGPEGQNVDVIAHEYTHAEVHYRVGWLSHYWHVPIWFNEGVSLLVDFRAPYLPDNIVLSQQEIVAVKQMGVDFFRGEHVLNNYQASRVLVDGLDKSRLYDNLERIKQGQDIHSVFAL